MSQVTETGRPGVIDAVPVRHPWRWVAVAVIAIIVAMMLSSFITNKRWDWGFALTIMNQNPVLEGLWKGTIIGTIGAMIIGVGLGILVAIMRLSENPVLRWASFAYTWFFRAIPRYVLLTERHTDAQCGVEVADAGADDRQQDVTGDGAEEPGVGERHPTQHRVL